MTSPPKTVNPIKERPILMHSRSINGILEGRKTQTRRIMKVQPQPNVETWDWAWPLPGKKTTPGSKTYWRNDCAPNQRISTFYSPYGPSGDRLWVRETWGIFSVDSGTVSIGFKQRIPEGKTIADTDGGLNVLNVDAEIVKWSELRINTDKWRPSIFMPRWASRLSLEITGIRVERVQDISEADAKAEGVQLSDEWTGCADDLSGYYREAFQFLWDDTNGKGAWDRNDWTWVVDFKRIRP